MMLSITAEDLIGKPFELGGRGPEYWDCYGLVIELAKRLGYYIPDLGTPDDLDSRISILQKVSSKFLVPIQKPELYSIIAFMPGTLTGVHVGMIYPDVRKFIHAGGILKPKRSVRINELKSWPWRNRVHGYFRFTKKLCQN